MPSHSQEDYASALDREQRIYANCHDVHNLPAAFHYWSNRHLRPKLMAHGFDSPDGLFLKALDRQCAEHQAARFISIGAGNGDLEIKLAKQLCERGYDNFVIECLDINQDMLERGREAAQKFGVENQLGFVRADFNDWTPVAAYDAVLANQSLHHVVKLEGLFGEIKRALKPTGVFVISDMVGRNGHQRWPEALQIVREFWKTLPPSYRQNELLGTYEEEFADWDCSKEGFEGVRAQDILGLLLERFHFQLFIPFGNVIDPFVDRAFGGHFDVEAEWDRAFLDRVHERDELEIAAGRITPTHLLAVLIKEPGPHLLPVGQVRRCVRTSSHEPVVETRGVCENAYAWASWPHETQRELEIACSRLATSETKCGRLLRERTAWAKSLSDDLDQMSAHATKLDTELARRTEWAQNLQHEIGQCKAWAAGLEQQFDERTVWAQCLQADAHRQAGLSAERLSQLESRTAWALRLNAELEERTGWALGLEKELEALRQSVRQSENHPFRQAARHFKLGLKQLFSGG